MVRTQVLLTEEQMNNLKLNAHIQGISVSEAIRRAINTVFILDETQLSDEVMKKSLEAVGAFRNGETDVSTEHDKYLAEAFMK